MWALTLVIHISWMTISIHMSLSMGTVELTTVVHMTQSLFVCGTVLFAFIVWYLFFRFVACDVIGWNWDGLYKLTLYICWGRRPSAMGPSLLLLPVLGTVCPNMPRLHPLFVFRSRFKAFQLRCSFLGLDCIFCSACIEWKLRTILCKKKWLTSVTFQ